MSNKKNDIIRIVKGSERFAGSTDVNSQIDVELKGTQKNYVEKDRTSILNSAEQFDKERQASNKVSISGKIINLFDNSISGNSTYAPFLNSLFYVNAETSIAQGESFKGFPPADEFSFFRTTTPIGHIPFVSNNASSYNWKVYVTYPYKNDYDQNLQWEDEYTNLNNNFVVSDGVPFILKKRKYNGKNLFYFYCGFEHGLSKGEYIELKNPISGIQYFEVYGLGDESFGNEKKVFSIFDFGYQNVSENTIGNFKRIVDIDNSEETKSVYYCRKHKLITQSSECQISKMGYENNPFYVESKIEYSALTPNQVQRISIRNNSQTVSFSLKNDIDISDLVDNNGLPLTKVFISVIKNGYVGWFNKPQLGSSTNIQVGWEHNFLNDGISSWWSAGNADNRDNIPSLLYQYNSRVFYYNGELNKDEDIKGDICEWNAFNQQEKVLSRCNHKINFNPDHFNDSENNNVSTLLSGYAYEPHHQVDLRVFSDYIETGDRDKVDLIPQYSFYSEYNQQWRWRDLYPYGFVDSDGKGIDNPFINGSHYPFKEIIFLQTPMKRNWNIFNDVIIGPTSDDCE